MPIKGEGIPTWTIKPSQYLLKSIDNPVKQIIDNTFKFYFIFSEDMNLFNYTRSKLPKRSMQLGHAPTQVSDSENLVREAK